MNRPKQREPGISLSEIPGFSAAVQNAAFREVRSRENAWLDLPHDICGFKIRIMTVRDYVILDRMESPFLFRVVPSIHQLTMFLWVLSPRFPKWNAWPGIVQHWAAYRHARRVKWLFGQNVPESSEAACKACFDYIDEMFSDAPPYVNRNGGESSLCYLTHWFDIVMSEYPYSEDDVWRMQIPKLFQLISAISHRNNPNMPRFNKGPDAVKAKLLRGLREKQFTLDDLKSGRVNLN